MVGYTENARYITSSHVQGLLGVLFLVFLGNWLFKYLNVRNQVKGLPAIHSWIEFFESGARSKLPHIPYIVPTRDYTIDQPFLKYEKAQSDLIALTQLSTPSHAVYITSSPLTAQHITSSQIYQKPLSMFRYQAINIFGLQIVSTNAGVHKRHKGVVRGCFGESVMENTWERMISSLEVMMKEEGIEGEGGVVKDIRAIMIKTTLLLIGQAGFSADVPWNIPKTDGPILPFPEALHIVETSLIPQLLLPLWLMSYSPIPYFRRLAKAQKSLIHHMKTMASSRRLTLQHEREGLQPGEKVKAPRDILGALVASQMDVEQEERLRAGDEGIKVGLTDKEIIGNIWIFIVAGHETAGHTLTWVLAYLSLDQQLQDDLYAEINEVCGDNLPSYRDISRLALILACAYESLRLRDLVMTIPKQTTTDTLLPYTTWDSAGNITSHTYPIKAGSHVIIDSPASQRNPFYWSDPSTFNPRRHLGEKGSETSSGYTGFSMGSRACIGKRFAEVEMVAFLSHVVKMFRLYPVEKFQGESKDETKLRMEHGSEELTFTPGNFDLRFERRH